LDQPVQYYFGPFKKLWSNIVQALFPRSPWRIGSAYRSGRAVCWVKVKNPAAPAARREAEEDWNKSIAPLKSAPRYEHLAQMAEQWIGPSLSDV
jgi:hypothetical protein